MISSSLLRFLELFSCSLAHPHIFLVFTSYQIPSHLVIKISPGLQPMSPSTHWPRVLLRWLKSRSILCYRGIDRTEVHWTTHTHDSESYEYRITQSLYVWDTPWESSQHPSHILLLHPPGLTMGIIFFCPSIIGPYFRDSSFSLLALWSSLHLPTSSQTIIYVDCSQ